jgi:hypothetical protein
MSVVEEKISVSSGRGRVGMYPPDVPIKGSWPESESMEMPRRMSSDRTAR